MVTASELMRREGIAGREYRRRQLAAVRPTPQQLQLQEQKRIEVEKARIESERKEELEGEIQDINKDLSVYQARVSNIQRRLREGGLSNIKQDQLEYDLTEAGRNITELNRSKDLLRKGYTPESVRRYTEQKILGWQERQIYKQKAVQFRGEPLVVWKEPSGRIRYQSIAPEVAAREGLTAVVVGFTGRGETGYEELPRYRAEFAPITAPPVTPESFKFPTPPSVIEPAPTTWEKVKRTLGFTKFQAEKRVGEVYGPPAKLAVSQIGLVSGIQPGFVSGVKIIKEFEEKKLREGTLYEREAPEWMERLDIEAQRRMGPPPGYKPPAWQKYIVGPEVTKKYYEFAGTRFDPRTGKVVREIEFYEPGERERIIEETLEPLKIAGTFEQQQQAIEALRRRGIKVKLTPEGEYEIDVEAVAPVSKLGRVLFDLTDVMFKMGLYGPLMRTGVYGSDQQMAEQIKKLTNRQKLEIYKKWIEEIRGKGGYKDKLRESLRKSLISGDKKEVKRVERIIKDIFAPTKEGKKAALSFIKDVKQQELIITEVTPTKVPIEEVIPIETPVIPVEEIVPSAYVGTGMYERYAPSELLYPPMIRERIEEEPLGATNIFEGISPIGKMEVEKLYEGKIAPMEVLGSRLGVIEELGVAEEFRIAEEQKAEQRARTLLQSRIKQEERARQRIGQVQWLGLSAAQISKQRLREKQRYKQITKQIVRPKPRPPRRVPRISVPPPITWWLPEAKRKRRRLRERVPRRPLEFGYRVEVRRRGRLVPVVPFAVPKGEALWLGRRAVKRGAAVTFKLKLVKEKPRKIGVPRITERALAIEFRKPIRKGITVEEPLTFIQKRRYRIVTPGEIREITMKGWAARRGRKEKWL